MTLRLRFGLAVAVCAGVARAGAAQGAGTPTASVAAAAAVSPADARFMSGMILHHAQAVLMAEWAPSHGASPSLRTLCARIANSQRDEIALMARWLTDHHLAVPDTGVVMSPAMAGMEHMTLMPGMLTAAQLAELDSARGGDFDRLFLTDMIRHHQGALTMVSELLAAPGAAQDNLVYQLAADVSAGQTVEIARMRAMLAELPGASKQP